MTKGIVLSQQSSLWLIVDHKPSLYYTLYTYQSSYANEFRNIFISQSGTFCSFKDKSVEIFKVDLNCNEELELAFDIYVMDLPVLLILRPKKHIYTMAVVKELSVSVDDFIGQALLGKVAHLKFKKLPKLNVGSCNTILHTNKESPNDKKKIRFEL